MLKKIKGMLGAVTGCKPSVPTATGETSLETEFGLVANTHYIITDVAAQRVWITTGATVEAAIQYSGYPRGPRIIAESALIYCGRLMQAGLIPDGPCVLRKYRDDIEQSERNQQFLNHLRTSQNSRVVSLADSVGPIQCNCRLWGATCE